jgi:hypothetical protein
MQLHAQRFPLALGAKHFILMAYATSNSHPLFSCITTFADHTHGNGVRLINILCLLSRHLQRFLISICIMNQRACVLATYEVCYAICNLFCLVTCCPAELQSLINNRAHIPQEYDMYLQQYYQHVFLLKNNVGYSGCKSFTNFEIFFIFSSSRGLVVSLLFLRISLLSLCNFVAAPLLGSTC